MYIRLSISRLLSDNDHLINLRSNRIQLTVNLTLLNLLFHLGHYNLASHDTSLGATGAIIRADRLLKVTFLSYSLKAKRRM